jgi:hypothetical protein
MDAAVAPQMGQRQPTIVCVIRIPSTGQTGTCGDEVGASLGMAQPCMPHLTSVRNPRMNPP